MEEMQNKIKKEIGDIKREVRNKTTGYILAGLSLVAGLAWNDAIKSLIEYFFPLTGSGILAKFIYAVIITLIVVTVGFYLTRILEEKK